MQQSTTVQLDDIASLLARCRPYLIVSPPRSCSTALSRALNQHSSLGAYVHEPCGAYSYKNKGLEIILHALAHMERGSLIKEMSFQFEGIDLAMCFLRNVANPPAFLVRSPQKTLESRMRLVLTDLASEPSVSERDKQRIAEAIAARNYAGMDDLLNEDNFPLFRTGWVDMGQQMAACRNEGLAYLVIRAEQFRLEPQTTLEKLCGYWGFEFEPAMLRWERTEKAPEGALARHKAWYTRVMSSTGVQPPENHDIQPEQFPKRFQDHLPVALEIYREALNSPDVI